MTPTEDKELHLQAIEEIRSLRREVEVLRAKVEVMDLFAVVLHTTPAYPTVGMGEDIVWKLQKRLAENDLEGSQP